MREIVFVHVLNVFKLDAKVVWELPDGTKANYNHIPLVRGWLLLILSRQLRLGSAPQRTYLELELFNVNWKVLCIKNNML